MTFICEDDILLTANAKITCAMEALVWNDALVGVRVDLIVRLRGDYDKKI